MSLEKYLETAIEAVIKAGDIIKKSLSSQKTIEFKGKVDLVTETDKECERCIISIIKHKHPNSDFLAEETANHFDQHTQSGDPPRWIIDPIDGTTNFVHGIPWISVSIGLEIDGEVQAGVVYNPLYDECFTAIKGKGAFLNQSPIKVSKTSKLGHSLIGTGFAYERKERADDLLKFLKCAMVSGQGIRRFGSAALDMCSVACGRLDVYYEIGIKPWDVAAGYLIVKEAGGDIFTPLGDPYDIYYPDILASNGIVGKDLIDQFKQIS